MILYMNVITIIITILHASFHSELFNYIHAPLFTL